MPRKLTEVTVTLIRDYLKIKMAAALADIRTDRADHKVTTEVPSSQSYFIYPKAHGYKLPAIFILENPGGIDFRQTETAANFITAKVRIDVSIVVEDKDCETLMYKAWRYQAALHEVLDQANLTSSDGKTKLTVVVMGLFPLPVQSNSTDATNDQASFRREIVLRLNVEHYENY